MVILNITTVLPCEPDKKIRRRPARGAEVDHGDDEPKTTKHRFVLVIGFMPGCS